MEEKVCKLEELQGRLFHRTAAHLTGNASSGNQSYGSSAVPRPVDPDH